jgi:ABC-2 type transport system ATP-binding protein
MEKQFNDNGSILKVTNLVKSFGKVKAVNGITFEVKPGEVFGLLGPNGAGKSTTIKQILGMLEPDEGEITVFGFHPEKDEYEIKKRIGYVAEDPLIYKSLTPQELFNFICSIRDLNGEKTTKKLAEYLESLDALPYYNRLIATLSRGNKQKVQLIAAFLHDPELLVLDEPLSGLDAKSVRVVKEMIKMQTERGGSVIFCTHILEVAEDLCDRIAILSKGKIVGMGTFEELRTQANRAKQSLEEVFLALTEESGNVENIINNLRNSLAADT